MLGVVVLASACARRDPRRWLVLAVMSLGTLIVFLDLTVVNTALPAISVELGASTSELQWVVDSYVLLLAGLLMLAGSVGDRYGRKLLLVDRLNAELEATGDYVVAVDSVPAAVELAAVRSMMRSSSDWSSSSKVSKR